VGMGILWEYPQNFPWVWDGYGDRNFVPTAALSANSLPILNSSRKNPPTNCLNDCVREQADKRTNKQIAVEIVSDSTGDGRNFYVNEGLDAAECMIYRSTLLCFSIKRQLPY